jgi:hypothetical protein
LLKKIFLAITNKNLWEKSVSKETKSKRDKCANFLKQTMLFTKILKIKNNKILAKLVQS